MSRPSVALVQRSIPHYRVPLFKGLMHDGRFGWTFYCATHDPEVDSGLVTGLTDLRPRRIRQSSLVRDCVWQSGIPVDSFQHQALLADYGWTILSNPLLFARARSAGIATIGWSKGIRQDLARRKSAPRLTFERASLALCDALVVYGETSRDYFVRLGVEPSRIFVAHNTVDTLAIARDRHVSAGFAAELAQTLGVDRSRPLVGYLGKLSSAKKVDAILFAFEVVRRSGIDAQLLIAGQGPLARSLDERIVSSAFRDSIFRLRDVPPGTEGGVFQLLDIYVAFGEPGLGVLEAMAHGKAVVCTPMRYPETELLIHSETAFLAEADTIDAFAFALSNAVVDKAARRQVARAAESVALERATLERMIESINAAVDFALAASSRRRGWRTLIPRVGNRP